MLHHHQMFDTCKNRSFKTSNQRQFSLRINLFAQLQHRGLSNHRIHYILNFSIRYGHIQTIFPYYIFFSDLHRIIQSVIYSTNKLFENYDFIKSSYFKLQRYYDINQQHFVAFKLYALDLSKSTKLWQALVIIIIIITSMLLPHLRTSFFAYIYSFDHI